MIDPFFGRYRVPGIYIYIFFKQLWDRGFRRKFCLLRTSWGCKAHGPYCCTWLYVVCIRGLSWWCDCFSTCSTLSSINSKILYEVPVRITSGISSHYSVKACEWGVLPRLSIGHPIRNRTAESWRMVPFYATYSNFSTTTPDVSSFPWISACLFFRRSFFLAVCPLSPTSCFLYISFR